MAQPTMPDSSPRDPAEAVRQRQQQDAEGLFERLEQVQVPDLTINSTLVGSSVILPGLLIRFVAASVLFRLNSAKKWRLVLREQWLAEPLRQWLGIEELTDFMERATVGWLPARVFSDTLSWQVAQCLAQCSVPQPVAAIRQTIRDLLLRDAEISGGGLALDRRFWRRFARKGERRFARGLAEECRRRIDFVFGQGDLSEVMEGRWLEVPALAAADRAKLEAVRVGERSERLQALQEAFDAGVFDFVAQLLCCSYSRYGRRPHHPLLLWKGWLTMLAVGCSAPARFLRSVDDSVQLRLFLEVMSHAELPSERRIKGFATERLSPVIEYLVLWHQFLLLEDEGIEIGSDFGTDSGDMHAQGRMKSDAATKHLTPLLGWLIEECRRFCQATGRDGLSEADQEVLLQAFEKLDWKALGNLGRNRQALIRAIRDTLRGGLVTPLPSTVALDRSPRDGPVPTDLASFAQGLAAEFFQRMKAFGEKFNSSVFYDPECSAHTKRSKTVHGYGVQFLTDLNDGLIWAFAVFPAGDGFRPEIADWVIQTKRSFGWGPIRLTSDREYTIAKAIHAARMKADPAHMRDMMGRHRAMSEGIVNNLMNHQGVRHARWNGLALARLQVGLAIVMLNTLKRYKIRHGQLHPMTLKPAA